MINQKNKRILMVLFLFTFSFFFSTFIQSEAPYKIISYSGKVKLERNNKFIDLKDQTNISLEKRDNIMAYMGSQIELKLPDGSKEFLMGPFYAKIETIGKGFTKVRPLFLTKLWEVIKKIFDRKRRYAGFTKAGAFKVEETFYDEIKRAVENVKIEDEKLGTLEENRMNEALKLIKLRFNAVLFDEEILLNALVYRYFKWNKKALATVFNHYKKILKVKEKQRERELLEDFLFNEFLPIVITIRSDDKSKLFNKTFKTGDKISFSFSSNFKVWWAAFYFDDKEFKLIENTIDHSVHPQDGFRLTKNIPVNHKDKSLCFFIIASSNWTELEKFDDINTVKKELLEKNIPEVSASAKGFGKVFVKIRLTHYEEKLEEELLTIYKSKGEEGLRDLVKNKRNSINSKFILDLAESGVKERKKEWLKICMIIAEEKNNEKTLADVYSKMGEFFKLISDNKKAFYYFDRALLIYEKLDDPAGQGNMYLGKGIIYFYIGDNSKALKLYEKALLSFENEKSNDILGQGNVYLRKGMIYFYTGDNSSARAMYDRALVLFKKVSNPFGQGNVYLGLGDIYLNNGDYSHALEMYDKALTFFEKAGNIMGLGNVYLEKGIIYSYIGDNSRALEVYDKALAFFEKALSPKGQGNVYLRKGIIYSYTGENLKTLEMYDKALAFFAKAGDIMDLGTVYLEKGIIYSYIGDNSRALEMYDKALPLFEKVENPLGQGNVYWRKGEIYSQTGNHARALAMYNKAAIFFETAKEPISQGNVYHSKGDVYLYIGDYIRALEMYDKALPLFKKVENPLGLGNLYWSKGEIHSQTGNIVRALEMYDKALTFFEKAGEVIGQGNVYHSKGKIYLKIGDTARSLEMYDKALLFFEKAGAPIGQGNVYRSKGDIYLNTGDTTKALEMYNRALTFFEKAGDMRGVGNVYRSKGDIYLKVDENTRALEFYEKALSFFKKLGDLMAQGKVYLNKVDIYIKFSDNSKALEFCDKALTVFTKLGDIESEAYALYKKAKALVKLGRKNEALAFYEKNIYNLDKVRGQIFSSEMKRTFLEKVYDQYEETAVFMLENKYYERGFKYAESMKSRTFIDHLAEGLVRLDKGIAPELKQKRDNLVSKLSTLNKKVNELARKGDDNRLKELKNQYRKVENEFEDLLVKIRLANPLYASIRYPAPISVQNLQKNILKKKELLLRYFTTTNKVYVFLISRKKFKVVELEVKEKDIKRIAQRYLLSFKNKNTKNMIKYGKELYQLIFKPIEKAMKRKVDIIIAPDGQLAKVPFESFVTNYGSIPSDKPVYLLEKYRLKYIQSASVLSLLRKHYMREETTKSFIGFGDPVYDYENFKQGKPELGTVSVERGETINKIYRGKYDKEGGIFHRLKYSGDEVKAIAEFFKGQSKKSAIYLREQANEENAKSAYLKEFDYIHFSCHGLLGDDFQSLVLSQIPQSTEDGYLTLNEITNCEYNAKLVVLSSCQTGTGKVERGEGVTGLTRAVMYAGTPAVVASLWNVSDIGTKELMVKFYKNMLEKGMSKEEALRQAKLDLINSEKYSSPYFWSAFVMYGE